MKRLLVLFFCTPVVFVNAQNDLFGSSSISNNSIILMEARDITGKPIPTNAQIVEGNPMLTDDFVNGVVKFKGDEKQYNLLVGFSLIDNQLYFKKDNATLKFANPLDNFSLVFKDKEATKIMNFKNGYPNVANNNEQTFYQVLLDGPKLQLVKYIYKSIGEKYHYGGPIEKEYVAKERLFVYDISTNTMAEIKPSVNSAEKALPSYISSIDKFVVQNKLKHDDDVIALVTYLNNEPFIKK